MWVVDDVSANDTVTPCVSLTVDSPVLLPSTTPTSTNTLTKSHFSFRLRPCRRAQLFQLLLALCVLGTLVYAASLTDPFSKKPVVSLSLSLSLGCTTDGM